MTDQQQPELFVDELNAMGDFWPPVAPEPAHIRTVELELNDQLIVAKVLETPDELHIEFSAEVTITREDMLELYRALYPQGFCTPARRPLT